MKQKYRMFTFVDVIDNPYFEDFFKDSYGIVLGTYSQKYTPGTYGGLNLTDYSLAIVQGDKIVNEFSWVEESQLVERKEQDRERAEEMFEEYLIEKAR